MAATSTAGHAPTSATTAAATPAASAAVDENSEFHVDQSPDAGIFADVDTTGLTVVDLVTRLYDMPGVPADRPDIANLRKLSPGSIIDIVEQAERQLVELARSPSAATRQLIATHFKRSEAARRPALCVLLYTQEAPNGYASIHTLLNAWLNSNRRQTPIVAEYIGPFFVEYCRGTSLIPRKTINASRAVRIRESEKLLHAFNHFDDVFRPSSVVNFWGVTSFTRGDDVASRHEKAIGLNDKVLLFKCEQLECVDMSSLSATPGEAEVQPLTPSSFRVVSSMRYHHKVIIVLQQITPSVRYTTLPAVPAHLVSLVAAIRDDRRNASRFLDLARRMTNVDSFPLFQFEGAATKLTVCQQLLELNPRSAEGAGILADAMSLGNTRPDTAPLQVSTQRRELYAFAINLDSPNSAKHCLALATLLGPAETHTVLNRDLSRRDLALLAYHKDSGLLDALMVVADTFSWNRNPILLEDTTTDASYALRPYRITRWDSANDVYHHILAYNAAHVGALWKLADAALGKARLQLLFKIQSIRDTAEVCVKIGEMLNADDSQHAADCLPRARDMFVRALHYDPTHFEATLSLARVTIDDSLVPLHGTVMTQRDLYVAAIKLNPNSAEAYFELAALVQDDYVSLHFGIVETRDLYLEVLRCQPLHCSACYGLALTMSDEEHVEIQSASRVLRKTKVELLLHVANSVDANRWPLILRDVSLAMRPDQYFRVHSGVPRSRREVFMEAIEHVGAGLERTPFVAARVDGTTTNCIRVCCVATSLLLLVDVYWTRFTCMFVFFLFCVGRWCTGQHSLVTLLVRLWVTQVCLLVFLSVFPDGIVKLQLFFSIEQLMQPTIVSGIAAAAAFRSAYQHHGTARLDDPVGALTWRALSSLGAFGTVAYGSWWLRAGCVDIINNPSDFADHLWQESPHTICGFGSLHHCTGWENSGDFPRGMHSFEKCWHSAVQLTPCSRQFKNELRTMTVFFEAFQLLLFFGVTLNGFCFLRYWRVYADPVAAIKHADPKTIADDPAMQPAVIHPTPGASTRLQTAVDIPAPSADQKDL